MRETPQTATGRRIDGRMRVDNPLEPHEIRIDSAHHAASGVELRMVTLYAPGGRRDRQPAGGPRRHLAPPGSRLVAAGQTVEECHQIDQFRVADL